MFKSKRNQLALLFAGVFSASWASAGFPVYPPETYGADQLLNGVQFFDDSSNAESAQRCHESIEEENSKRICVVGYYLPLGMTVARTATGVPMLTQGIFFSGRNREDSKVVYNLTLEADFRGAERALKFYKTELAHRYGVPEATVSLSPVTTSSVQFLVRSRYGADSIARGTEPSPSPGESPAPSHELVFTDYLVPQWTGNLHNLGSRFSVGITGSAWDLEPTLKTMFRSQGGNALVGQVSFGIPVMTKPYNASFSCDFRKIQQTFRSTAKSWDIRRWSNGRSSHETFNNEERNAVRSSINIADFCEIKELVDTTLSGSELLKSRANELFQRLFDQAFKTVSEAAPGTPAEGKDAKYTYLESNANVDAHGKITIKMDQSYIFNAKSDLDFYAGDIPEANFDPASKYLCQKFERFNVAKQACEVVCEPNVSIYRPGHPQADPVTKCVQLPNAKGE